MWRDFSRKKAVLGLAIFVIIVVLIWWTNIIPILNQRHQEYKVLSGIDKLKEAYRNDTYGGATPEETLKMFTEAFKVGDLNLASKYFIPEKQSEYLAKMQNWVKLGKVEEIVSLLSRAKWSGDSNTNQDQMDVWNSGKELEVSVFFFQNENSKKWKLMGM